MGDNTGRCIDCKTPVELDGRDPATVRCVYCEQAYLLWGFAKATVKAAWPCV